MKSEMFGFLKIVVKHIKFIILTIFKVSSSVALSTFMFLHNQSPELFCLAELKLYKH